MIAWNLRNSASLEFAGILPDVCVLEERKIVLENPQELLEFAEFYITGIYWNFAWMFAYWKNTRSYLNAPKYTIMLLDNRLEFAEFFSGCLLTGKTQGRTCMPLSMKATVTLVDAVCSLTSPEICADCSLSSDWAQ